MFKNIKTKYKLIASVAGFFSVMVVMGFFLYERNIEKEIIHEHIEMHIQMPEYALRAQLLFNEIIDSVEDLPVCSDVGLSIDEAEIQYADSVAQFNEAENRFGNLVSEHDERWVSSQEESAEDQLHADSRRMIALAEDTMQKDRALIVDMKSSLFLLVQNGEIEKAKELFKEKLLPLIKEERIASANFVSLQEWESQFHASELDIAIQDAEKLILIINLLIILFVIVAAYALVYFVFNPLNEYASAVEKISTGDLSRRIRVEGLNTEIGRLTERFNEMMDSIDISQKKLEQSNSKLKQEKIKLLESENKFHNLTSLSPDCIKTIGMDGRIEYMSPGGLEEHGFKSLEEAIGWDFLDSVEDYQRDQAKKALEDCLINGKSATMEIDHKHGTANREWCNLSMMPIKDEAGKITGALAISRDISALKLDLANLSEEVKGAEQTKKAMINLLEDFNLEKKETELLAKDLEKFKLAVENVSDHIVITDADGVILYANKAVEKITGYSNAETIGKKAGSKDLWGGLMPMNVYEDFWKTIKQDKRIFVGEFNNKRKNGEVYDAAANVAPIMDRNGNVIFFVGIERDVTREKEIDRAKTEFVSLASHQLRTPLTAINWYVEMMLNGDAGKINTEQKSYLEEVANGSRRMVDLVNALLNVSRIDLGTFAVEPELIDFRDVAKDVLIELKPSILNKKMQIKEEYDKDLPKVNADSKLVRIIFQNLLSNAVKYTPEKGKIIVGINTDKKYINISIADNGYGIPASQQGRIFEKLFRADNARQKETDGTGLGLYVIKSIVEKNGGQASFKSKENKGTTFLIKLPLSGMKKKEGTRGLSAA